MSWIRGEKQLKQHVVEMSTGEEKEGRGGFSACQTLILVKLKVPYFIHFQIFVFFIPELEQPCMRKKKNSFSRKLKLRLCCAFQMFVRQKHGSRDGLSVCNKHLGGGCCYYPARGISSHGSNLLFLMHILKQREGVMKTKSFYSQ